MRMQGPVSLETTKWNVVSRQPLLEAPHLGWKTRLLLWVKVTYRVHTLQARARCCILTNGTQNSNGSL